MTPRQPIRTSQLLLIATIWALGTAAVCGQASGLYRNGKLVEEIDFFSVLSDRHAQPAASSFVSGPVTAATERRRAAASRCAEAVEEMRELLESSRPPGRVDRAALQALLGECRAAMGELQTCLGEIDAQIRGAELDPKVLQRHRRGVAAMEQQHRGLRAVVQGVIRRERHALPKARRMLAKLTTRKEPRRKPNKSVEPPPRSHDEEAPEDEAPEEEAPEDDPVPADLAETVEIQFTPEIIAKAAELGNSPLAIYEFVKNNAVFQAYRGSRKGAAHTLAQMAGNDVDQASLLMALLRAAGHPCRYVRGTVQIDADAAMAWIGTDEADVAADFLASGGLDAVAIRSGGIVVTVEFTHVWVETYVPYSNYRGAQVEDTGLAWVPLSPSFKALDVVPGEDVLTPMGFDIDVFQADLISTFRPELPLEKFEADLQAWLDVNDPGKAVADIVRSNSIAPESLGMLPASTPFKLAGPTTSFAELEDDQRYEIRFHLYDGGTALIDHTVYLSDIAASSITVGYVGATPADDATLASFGGVYNTPLNLVDLKVVLEIDHAAVATSTNTVSLGDTHSFDMEFLQPLGSSNSQPLVQNTAFAGIGQVVAFDTYLDSPTEVTDRDTVVSASFFESLMHTTAREYLNRVDRGFERAEGLMGIVSRHDVSPAIVGHSIDIESPLGLDLFFDWRGLLVDADRRVISAFGVDGDPDRPRAFKILTGLHGSNQENRVFEDLFSQDAISTVKVLQLASDAGIPICTITTSIAADCPGFSQSASVESKVNAALAEGRVVTIPRDPITVGNWTGTGYIKMLPSGVADYLLSGGISGGVTVEQWPINAPCAATSVNGVILDPPMDHPDMDAVFCADGTKLIFEVELTYTCPDGSGGTTMQTITQKLPFSNTTEQLGPNEYEVRLVQYGVPPSVVRKFVIIDIVSETFIDTPAPKTRTKVGVGEDVDINFLPAHLSGVTWSISGPGTLSTPGGPFTSFKAHEQASNPVIKANYGGRECEIEFEVVEPSGIAFQHKSSLNANFIAGQAGTKMVAEVKFHPTDVSFYAVQWKEVSGNADPVTGYFGLDPPFPSVHNLYHTANAAWETLTPENTTTDEVGFNFSLPDNSPPNYPAWADGSFTWVIPNKYRVIDAPTVDGFPMPNTTQIFSISANGDTTVTKQGVGAAAVSTRSP